MQILHPFSGSIQQYCQQLKDPGCYRLQRCPQCNVKKPLTSHGFYCRTIVDGSFDGVIRVRRYLCRFCRRTVSLLPEFALPYLRSSIVDIALFLIARLKDNKTLIAAARAAAQPEMPYQRGQQWIRRFQKQATAVAAALVSLTQPIAANDFVVRALDMLERVGWIRAHRFLFSELRLHLLGWPQFLAPDGRCRSLRPG